MKTAWDKRAVAHSTIATSTAGTEAAVNADDRAIALLAPAVVTLASVCPCTHYPAALVQLLLQQIEVSVACCIRFYCLLLTSCVVSIGVIPHKQPSTSAGRQV
jgi:hypothetical protein